MTIRLLSIWLLLSLLPACVHAQPTFAPVPTTKLSPIPESIQWWQAAVFYEIFVRSFYDSNGDGIGDFNGITQKLDYLEDLGVTGIWLMPIHPSPSYHGYDVTDYYAVNPDYGTMDDFKQLLEEAHQRGMHIIIDLVLNHTSFDHPWAQSANDSLISEYRNWYIWSDISDGSNWHKGKYGYYYGLFCSCMPDLNYNNPEVTKQMLDVTRFWLQDIGVDGFRVDAAKHLIEEGDLVENTPATHAWYQGFYEFYKSQNPQAYTVGEVFGAGALLTKIYSAQEFDHIFSFEMASGIVNSANGGSNSGIDSAIKFSLMDAPDFNFATFLANHDQDRVMSVLDGDVEKAKVAAFLLLTSPGTPFIYYGEEIGMQGKKPDEDIRLPMQWSAQISAGFSTGTPWRAPNADYKVVNVAEQANDPNSLLSLYSQLIAFREVHSVLRTGQLHLLETNNSGVYAILRVDSNERILVLVNLTTDSISDYKLTLEDAVLRDGAYEAKTLFGKDQATGPSLNVSQGPEVVQGIFKNYKPVNELPPYSTLIVEFQY